MFTPPKGTVYSSLEHFDFNYIANLFVENRLFDWIGQSTPGGKAFNSINDFFQEGYIPAQIKAFFWGLDTMPEELNFSWMSHLHFLSTHNLVHEEDGVPIRHAVRSRVLYMGFATMLSQMAQGFPDKASPAGIEVLQQGIVPAHDEETRGKIYFNLQDSNTEEYYVDAEEAKACLIKQVQFYEQNKEWIAKLLEQANVNPATAFATSTKDDDTWKSWGIVKEEIARENMKLLLCMVGYSLMDKNPFQIRHKAERMITIYNNTPKITDIEKIDAVIILVKGLLNLHVWSDGNGRLCAHHLLNLLLIKNGLKPAFLKNNCLDAFTLEELRERVQTGMILFAAKCHQPEKTLEKFREDNNLPLAKESDFIMNILNNNLNGAKDALVASYPDLAMSNLAFYASCAGSEARWLDPFFASHTKILIDSAEYEPNNLLILLLQMALDNANEKLVFNLLEAGAFHGFHLDDSTIIEIFQKGNIHMYEFIHSIWNVNLDEQILDNCMLVCRDDELSIRFFHECMNRRMEYILMNHDFIKDIFEKQSPAVLLAYMQLPCMKWLVSIKPELMEALDIVTIVSDRLDLKPEEKTSIIKSFNPHLEYYFNPEEHVSDLSSASEPVKAPDLR